MPRVTRHHGSLCPQKQPENKLLHLSTGASAETHAKNRQELYEVSTALEQAAKKRQTVAAKQGKNSSLSSKQKPDRKAGGSAVAEQPGSSAVHASPVGSDKHKAAGTSANGQANGSVKSPGIHLTASQLLLACKRGWPAAHLTEQDGLSCALLVHAALPVFLWITSDTHS